MRTTSIVILAIVLFASTNALTAQAIIAAVNFARKNPLIIRDRIKAQFPNMTGTASDATCYSDAINFLSVQAPLPPLAEDPTADFVTWDHSRYCVRTLNKISHTGAGGSNPGDRLKTAGIFNGAWSYNENIAVTYRQNTDYPPADEFIIMWITDCGVASRGHRANIYSTKVDRQGCGVFQGPMTASGMPFTGTVVTCAGTKGLAIKEETKVKLAEAGLSMDKNGLGFTGI